MKVSAYVGSICRSFFCTDLFGYESDRFYVTGLNKKLHYIWWIHEDKAKQTCFIVVQVLGSSTKGGTRKTGCTFYLQLKENLCKKIKKDSQIQDFFF